jgi:hypothetical protein
MLFMKALNILKVVIDYIYMQVIDLLWSVHGDKPQLQECGKKTQSCPKIGIIIICAPDLSN